MHPLVESHRTAIQDLCRRHGVRRLEAFGSAVEGGFDTASSDVDFLVDLGELELFSGGIFGPQGRVRIDAGPGDDEVRTPGAPDAPALVAWVALPDCSNSARIERAPCARPFVPERQPGVRGHGWFLSTQPP